jgi:Flp pilus assembly protein TadD
MRMNKTVLIVGAVVIASASTLRAGEPTGPGPDEPAAGAPAAAAPDDQDLPVPPVPPRIAEGADYDRCLAMLTDDPTGAHTFADAWVATGGGDAAAHCLGLADVALGEAESGAEALDKLASESKAPAAARAAVFGQAGQAWLMAGDPNRALASATQALTLTPDDADLLIDRSIAAANLEHYEDAVEDLSHALDLDPHRPEALVFRSAAWRRLEQVDLARDDIDRALALDPDNPDALLERGILRQRRGDRAGAREDWERTVALDPDGATADLAQQNLALLEAGPDRR